MVKEKCRAKYYHFCQMGCYKSEKIGEVVQHMLETHQKDELWNWCINKEYLCQFMAKLIDNMSDEQVKQRSQKWLQNIRERERLVQSKIVVNKETNKIGFAAATEPATCEDLMAAEEQKEGQPQPEGPFPKPGEKVVKKR